MEKDAIYSQVYGKFDPRLQTENRIEKILAFLSGRRYTRMLDVGCGDGTLTTLIARTVQAKEVYGVEISEEGTAKALEKGIICAKVNTDKDPLPFPNDHFDFIFCGEVIEHVFDTDSLVEELARVLKPGGHLLVTTPNLAAWHGRFSLLLGCNPLWCSISLRHPEAGKFLGLSPVNPIIEHIRFFTLKGLKDLLRCNAFRIHTTLAFYARPHRSMGLTGALVGLLDKFFTLFPSWATMIGVMCIKPEQNK